MKYIFEEYGGTILGVLACAGILIFLGVLVHFFGQSGQEFIDSICLIC